MADWPKGFASSHLELTTVYDGLSEKNGAKELWAASRFGWLLDGTTPERSWSPKTRTIRKMSVDNSELTEDFLRLFSRHRLAPPHLGVAGSTIHVRWSSCILKSLKDSRQLEDWQREVIGELTGENHVLNWLRTHGLLPTEVFSQVEQVEAYRFANYLGISVGQLLKSLKRSTYRVPYAETFISVGQLEQILVRHFSHLVPGGRTIEESTEKTANDEEQAHTPPRPLDESAQKWLDEYLASEGAKEFFSDNLFRSDEDLHSCLAVLMSIAAADGVIDDRELDEIYRAFRDDFGCTEQQLDMVSSLLDHPDEIRSDWAASDFPTEMAKELLEIGFRVANADNEFHDSEKNQLAALRQQFGIAANDVVCDTPPRLSNFDEHQKRLLAEFLHHPACYLLDRSFLRQVLLWRKVLSLELPTRDSDGLVDADQATFGGPEAPSGESFEVLTGLIPVVDEPTTADLALDELIAPPEATRMQPTSSSPVLDGEPETKNLKDRLRFLLEKRSTDCKPFELWEEYSQKYKDGVTQRQIHELLLLDRMFARTRSGHFQLAGFGKPKALTPRWTPKSPTDWLIAIAVEISQTTECENEEIESAALLRLMQALVDYSDLEVASLRDYIARIWLLPKAPGFWNEAKLPLGLANLVTLAGVVVAASDRSPSLEEQRILTRVARALGVNGESLAGQLHDFAYRKRLNTTDEHFFLALELPELKDRATLTDKYSHLLSLYQPEEFRMLGVDYGLFAEKRRVRMRVALDELRASSDVPAERSTPADRPVAPEKTQRQSEPESPTPACPNRLDKVNFWAAQSQRYTQPVGTEKEVYTDNSGHLIGEQSSQDLPVPAAIADLITINQASKLFETPLSDLYAAAYRRDLEFRGYKKVIYSRTGREGQKIRLLNTRDVQAWLVVRP